MRQQQEERLEGRRRVVFTLTLTLTLTLTVRTLEASSTHITITLPRACRGRHRQFSPARASAATARLSSPPQLVLLDSTHARPSLSMETERPEEEEEEEEEED